MKLSIEHETVYRYDAPVRSSTQYLRLTPRETSRQNVLQWQIDTPRAATQTHDGYGNVLHVLTLDTVGSSKAAALAFRLNGASPHAIAFHSVRCRCRTLKVCYVPTA